MRGWWPIFALLVSLAYGPSSAHGQLPAASPKPDDKTGAPVTAANVAPNAPVITLDGICGSDLAAMMNPGLPSKPSGSTAATPHAAKNSSTGVKGNCRTIVTRAQFEKLAHVISPKQPPQAAAQLAHFYSTQLLYAHKAHELGLDKDPSFDEILRFTYLQVLARAFTNHQQQQADAKANAVFDNYYKQHPDEFEQVQVLQISVPKQKDHSEDSSAPAPASAVDTAAEAVAMKEEAEKIRSRAIAGEDFGKLEEEAYAFANAPNDSPDADMGDNTRADMAPFDKEVFALQPGQVSELLSGTEAWHIFKVVSRHMMPPDEARKRIAAKLMKEEMDSVNNSVKPQLNNTYFEPTESEPANPSGGDTK